MPTRPVYIFDHPVIQTRLTELRDFHTDHQRFRALLSEVASLMVYEVTRDLPTRPHPVQTPMERTTGHRLAKPIVLVPILRAGIGMAEGVLRLLPDARVGHIGACRNEQTLEASCYYTRLPHDIAQAEVLVLDPMLATGGTAISSINTLKEAGATSIRFVCIIASPEGLQALNKAHPEIPVFAASVDRQLNEKGYILPGLGDAGDRLFGT